MRTEFIASVILFSASVSASCAGHRAGATPPLSSRRPTAKPPVVVSIVVDQLADWVLRERIGSLTKTGGFARLSAGGIHTLTYDHAITETAPGHATLYTGKNPHEHGIVANERIDPTSRKRVSFLRDESTSLLTASGRQNAHSSSISALASATVSDIARQYFNDGISVISISIKDRGAIFGGGRKGASVWFDADTQQFVTSTAFGESLPAWAVAPTMNLQKLQSEDALVWAPLEGAAAEALHAVADDAVGEGNLEGLGTTFPHAMNGKGFDPKKAGVRFRATPFADEAVLELATRAIASSPPSLPLFVTLSLSANDYVGHVFGPHSREAWDALLRLDLNLGIFLDMLDKRFGESGYSVVLTADHGVAPLPEKQLADCKAQASRTCTMGERIEQDALATRLREVATRTLGEGDFVLGVADPYVLLTKQAQHLESERHDKLVGALNLELMKTPGIEAVYDTADETVLCKGESSSAETALVCNAMSHEVYPGLFIRVGEGSFFDPDYTPGKGTSHGSIYDYDRKVPFLLKSPGVRAVDGSAQSYAPWLLKLLGVTQDGRL
jgi:Type I phosphodiesterase / nucleotide pyrophosphatase